MRPMEAYYITPHDPSTVTGNVGGMPSVSFIELERQSPLEAETQRVLGNEVEGESSNEKSKSQSTTGLESQSEEKIKESLGENTLQAIVSPSRTNPLFPPLPLYGPSSLRRELQCWAFRTSSFFLSLAFLSVIVFASACTSMTIMFKRIWLRSTFRNPDASRPFYEEENRMRRQRKENERLWKKERKRRNSRSKVLTDSEEALESADYIPTEGGPDPLICDVGYYARRVGLDIEEFKVRTEDGFIITLWHIYDPRELKPSSTIEGAVRGPNVDTDAHSSQHNNSKKPKFPVLMIHGLLQSSGAYCTNDDSSLAFYLCKSGYDVWLGNNRCGFNPEHTQFSSSDPRMWSWTVREMGTLDLPALISRVLSETGFSKLGLICHSQGTTSAFVGLAKDQDPDLGNKISVFCALSPAVYAGPVINRIHFKIMRVISPALFRITFGIHAFIPFMITMHQVLPGRVYGFLGYHVFRFLFNWSDARWDRGFRDRMFQFAPVYVSAELMCWWLGKECFAKHGCILATKEESDREEYDDSIEDRDHVNSTDRPAPLGPGNELSQNGLQDHPVRTSKGYRAWYDERVPPLALWVAGSDGLVDGRRLLRRFEKGREPHVRIVHSKVIEEYEHLDVIWAMDSIEKVGREVKEVLWRTCGVQSQVRVPAGCEGVLEWGDPKQRVTDAVHNGQGGAAEK